MIYPRDFESVFSDAPFSVVQRQNVDVKTCVVTADDEKSIAGHVKSWTIFSITTKSNNYFALLAKLLHTSLVSFIYRNSLRLKLTKKLTVLFLSSISLTDLSLSVSVWLSVSLSPCLSVSLSLSLSLCLSLSLLLSQM